MAQDGDGNSPEAVATKADTTSGVEAKTESVPRGGEVVLTKETLPSPNEPERDATPAKPKAKTPLGTPQERLEILQEAAKMFQQAGGSFRVGWTDRSGTPTLVLAIPNAVIADNLWMLVEPKPKAKAPADPPAAAA